MLGIKTVKEFMQIQKESREWKAFRDKERQPGGIFHEAYTTSQEPSLNALSVEELMSRSG